MFFSFHLDLQFDVYKAVLWSCRARFFQINHDLHLKKPLLLIIIDTLWFCKEGEIDFIYLGFKSKVVYMLIWSCLSWFCICNESRSVTHDAILAFSSPVKTEGEDGWSRGPPFPEVPTTTSSLLPPTDAPIKVSNVDQMDISSNMEVSAPRPIKKPSNTGSFVKPTHPAGGRRPKHLRMNHW